MGFPLELPPVLPILAFRLGGRFLPLAHRRIAWFKEPAGNTLSVLEET